MQISANRSRTKTYTKFGTLLFLPVHPDKLSQLKFFATDDLGRHVYKNTHSASQIYLTIKTIFFGKFSRFRIGSGNQKINVELYDSAV